MKRFSAGAAMLLALLAAGPIGFASQARAEIDARLILPPPPPDGSVQARDELTELDRIVAARTPEALAQATSDDETENPTIYRSVIGPGFDLKSLPATARLLDDIMRAQEAAAGSAKKYFARNRPWVVEPGISTCGKRGGAHTSYPSGHATMGYAVGVALASLMPAKAQAILTRGRDYAENRLVCGMHFRRDIVAGEVLGTAVALDMMQDAQFKAEFDAAEAELKTAHLAQ